MKKTEQEALQFLSEMLVEIRMIAANPAKHPNGLKTIHDFADAMHNLPRIIAEGSGERNAFVIDSAVEQGVKAWVAAFPTRKPNSVLVDLVMSMKKDSSVLNDSLVTGHPNPISYKQFQLTPEEMMRFISPTPLLIVGSPRRGKGAGLILRSVFNWFPNAKKNESRK